MSLRVRSFRCRHFRAGAFEHRFDPVGDRVRIAGWVGAGNGYQGAREIDDLMTGSGRGIPEGATQTGNLGIARD
jgi:hypothetical protein